MKNSATGRPSRLGWALLAVALCGSGAALAQSPLLHDGMRAEAAPLLSTGAASALRSGVIERVDAVRGELVIDGRTLAWDSRQLRIVHSGAAAPVAGLQAAQTVARLAPGQRVRYALSAGPQPRVQQLYLEAAR
ncbi:MAG: hypothetical protein L6Q75_00300 [Burkholderiaceae bacterium]|nr:hypothetical protein [Burkholderiaceae bacterium]